jgi:hypothetical protein
VVTLRMSGAITAHTITVLPAPGGDKHTQIVTAEGFYSALLWPGQCCCERELLRIAGRPFVGQLKATAGLLDQRGNCVGQAARSRRPSSTVSS